MSHRLNEEDILNLLGDGTISDMDLSDDELEYNYNDFPHEELENMMYEFDDDLFNELHNIVDETNEDEENNSEYDMVSTKDSIRWVQMPFNPPKINLRNIIDDNLPEELPSPLNYFFKYFEETDFENMVYYTNLYAIQNQKKFKPTNIFEIKIFIGIQLLMGALKFPRIRMYWEHDFEINAVCNNMTRDRFFAIRTNFHVIDNEKIPKNNNDKFVKVRPLYDIMKKKCNLLNIERNICIDEQIIPFKGQLSVKQFSRGKPYPWGIKVFLLCGESGIVYDLLLYQGSTTELNPESLKSLGLGASVVLHLTKNIEKNRHNIYFDNFFTTFQLLEILQKKQIFAIGTIRTNRFSNLPFLSDKEMKELGRGSTYEISTNMSNCNIGLIKWFDNKAVALGSNYVTSGKTDEVRRWNKKNKYYEVIERPEVVRLYNKSMGGVDKMNQLISFYRTFIRSKKWPLRMICHVFDVAVANSWLQYKKDAEGLNVPKKYQLDLMKFKIDLAKDLINVGKTISPKRRGRPAATNDYLTTPTTTKIKKVDSERPSNNLRTDTVDHLADFDDKKIATRCKYYDCKRRTHIFCLKCKVHLCLDSKSKCFRDFHLK